MEILVAPSFPRLPIFPRFSDGNRKSSTHQLLNCSRPGSSNDVVVHQNHLKYIGNEKEEKHNKIWQLFEEAQQNILYLNKQRLLAMEELERVKNENNSLLVRIEQLELKKEANVSKDKLTISSELLLRIDSLVLDGVIGSKEASDLRRLIMDSRGNLADNLYDISSKSDAEFLAELRHFSKNSQENRFHIIHICTEMSPVISVGSLASYITGCSRALQRKGNLVEVILPKYACLDLDKVQGLREVEAEFYSYFNGQLHGNKIWTGVVNGIGVTFIQPIYYSSFFSHEKIYGCPNDFERFTYFSRASLDYLVKSGKRPDVLHIHNWQTSIVAPLFWDVFVNQGLEGTRIVLTCQGFDSQCLEQPEKLALCGLDPSGLLRPDRLQDNMANLVNVLKGGVVYSNKVIIMSSVQTKGQIVTALGHGLEPTLAIHKEKLVIAPFGFDKATWDPSCDNFLPQRYNEDDMKGKFVCKVALQRRLGLHEEASEILVGCIYSDIMDADLDKLKRLVWMACRRGVQVHALIFGRLPLTSSNGTKRKRKKEFVFMESGQTPGMRSTFEILQNEVKDENVRFIDEYDEELSHLVISGSDIMLCPSFEDPLLQVPLKAIRYGAAPVAVHSGNSRFRDFGDERSKFSEYIFSTFWNTSLGQAIDEIKNDPSEWNRRIKDAMRMDFSWDSECADLHISTYAGVQAY